MADQPFLENIKHSQALPTDVLTRLKELAGHLSADG